jgi:hypothetical protein
MGEKMDWASTSDILPLRSLIILRFGVSFDMRSILKAVDYSNLGSNCRWLYETTIQTFARTARTFAVCDF